MHEDTYYAWQKDGALETYICFGNPGGADEGHSASRIMRVLPEYDDGAALDAETMDSATYYARMLNATRVIAPFFEDARP